MNDNHDLINNNQVCVVGEVLENPVFSHESYGENIYKFELSIERVSGYKDVIPVQVSKKLLDSNHDYEGAKVSICGQIRTFNQRFENGKSKLRIYIFARNIDVVGQDTQDVNEVALNGFICKPVVKRTTPLGREIADLLIGVNRPYGSSDYIPCICWGRDAIYAERELPVGAPITILGRIQSRAYTKRFEDETEIEGIAYEVSASQLAIREGQA